MRNHWLEAVVVAGSGGTRSGFTGYDDREYCTGGFINFVL